VGRGDDYVFHAGSIYGHNIVIATLPAGQEYGTGSAAALASQLKKFFPNLWFGLLVGVAAGLPDLSQNPARDIRLGDVLVALPNGDNAELIAYDLGKETEDGFQPLRIGHALGASEPIVRAAIGSIKLEAPNDADIFLPYYEAIRDKEHATGTFADPGQDRDILYVAQDSEFEKVVERIPRPESKRTRVWYGPIGSGDKLLKNAQKRNELRDTYGLIGLEMEAAGTMNRIPVSVIRGVCDYGDKHKNKIWQPYAAAMAASYAKAVLHEIPPRNPSGHDAPEVGYGPISRPTISGKTEEQNIELVNTSGLTCEYKDDRPQTRLTVSKPQLANHVIIFNLLGTLGSLAVPPY
jgi:nucleoside phosphorylase